MSLVGTCDGLMRDLLSALEEQGWRLERTARGHLRCASPDGKTIVVTGGTPSDKRSALNFRAQLRRAGARV